MSSCFHFFFISLPFELVGSWACCILSDVWFCQSEHVSFLPEALLECSMIHFLAFRPAVYLQPWKRRKKKKEKKKNRREDKRELWILLNTSKRYKGVIIWLFSIYIYSFNIELYSPPKNSSPELLPCFIKIVLNRTSKVHINKPVTKKSSSCHFLFFSMSELFFLLKEACVNPDIPPQDQK